MSGETVFCPGVVVADSDLVAGLLAVAPHAGKPDQGRGAHRVRLYADPASGWLAIAADGRGTALARVPAVASGEYWSTPGEPWDGQVGDVIDVDVSAPVAALVAKAFRRREGAGHRLEVLVDEHRRFLSVTDVEGLFPGRSLRVVLEASVVSSPDTRRDVGRLLLDAAGLELAASASFTLAHEDWRAWQPTASALGGLTMRATVDGTLLMIAGQRPSPDCAGALIGDGLAFLGAARAMGTGDEGAGLPAYRGPLLDACAALALPRAPQEQEETTEDPISDVISLSTRTRRGDHR